MLAGASDGFGSWELRDFLGRSFRGVGFRVSGFPEYLGLGLSGCRV